MTMASFSVASRKFSIPFLAREILLSTNSLSSGTLSKLVGKKVDKEGKIWSESGKVIGTAELIPVEERDEITGKPFEDFPDAVVNKEGHIIY